MSDGASLTNSSSWAPVGETSFDILNDSVNLIASTTICGVAYGAVLPLYFICVYELWLQLKRPERRHQSLLHLSYITLLVVLLTLYLAGNSRTTQLAYVNDRNYPLGPAIYAQVIFYLPVSIMGLFAFFAINWLTDIILIWRLYTVYGGGRLAKTVSIIPSLMFLGSLAMSLVTLDESLHVGESFWSQTAVKFVLGYYALSMSTTIVATGLLLIRLLVARRQARKNGQSNSSAQFLGAAAILVESSAFYTVWSIIFLGLYIVNNPIQYVFLGTLSAAQTIALLLIIYRVTRGTAWSRTTVGQITTIAFKDGMVEKQSSSGFGSDSDMTVGATADFSTSSHIGMEEVHGHV